ncbi:aminotransferase class V-fold PLP-dependent enzyme [Microlunatus panaciterrae]|uniref:Isopenicillin-N epimerase n=1 Tax=Microlunatus panaciterrae TaxID=400768 RepID=A0ABS2RJZ1_9ACTN|nr:aminotransferase class V-fold PLP-dependent enzyme [Microlunatus panaciterrae]MBM7799325.1 isopenicillin-N epimerase [Microlunatus panaciterrae]
MNAEVPASQATDIPLDPTVVDSLWAPDHKVLQVNHGSFGRVPTETSAFLHALIEVEDSNPQGWFRTVRDEIADARVALAEWIGVDEHRMGLVQNASAGMTIALNTLGPEARGRKIIFTDHIYGAVQYAIERTAARTGAVPVRLSVPLDADDDQVVAAIAAELDGAAMLVVDQITSATAKLLPVGRLARLSRDAGVPIAIDGAHAPGLIEAPVAGIEEADFWTGNFHKWPCTPRGTAALVVSEDRLDTVPLVASWYEHEPFARRFDQQGTASCANWVAAPHAVHLIEQRLGWAAVRSHMSALADAAQQLVCSALDVAVPEVGRTALSMRLVPLPAGVATDPLAAGVLRDRIADEHGIETAVTCFAGQGYVRLSAHAYNTLDDYQRLSDALVAISPTAS